MSQTSGEDVHVSVKDIASGQQAFVALGSWDTIGVLKKRLEGKGLGAFDQQVRARKFYQTAPPGCC